MPRNPSIATMPLLSSAPSPIDEQITTFWRARPRSMSTRGSATQGRVDEPRLERPAVEGTEDALEAGVDGQEDDGVGHQQQAQRRDRDHVGQR